LEGRKEGRKGGREEGRKEGRKEGSKEGRKEGRKEGGSNIICLPLFLLPTHFRPAEFDALPTEGHVGAFN